MQVNVKYRSWSYQNSQKLQNQITLVVITQPLSLHYVFISYNKKPHFLEFIYLEREDSYTSQVCLGYKTWILNLELWGEKRGGAWLLYQNLVFNSFVRWSVDNESNKDSYFIAAMVLR